VGDIHYRGPNVSMGYAESRADLDRGDDFDGRLATGDLGYLDDEGFLYITGRSKRITKISGVRVSLDDIERLLDAIAPLAAVANPSDGVSIFTACADPDAVKEARKRLARELRAPLQLIRVSPVPSLPLLPNGKVDYATLSDWAGQEPSVQ
jgi:acyl-CoA synthetase (AMP-forming)/AMP-acid ligase II